MRVIASVAGVALLVTAMFGLDWFHVRVADPVLPFIGAFRVSLRALAVCDPAGTCETMSLAQLHGAYPELAIAALWSGAGTIAVVVAQLGLARTAAGARLAPVGYAVASASFVTGALAAYAFAPSDFADGAVVERTWAPLAMLAGNAVAVLALRANARPRPPARRAISEPDRLPATPLTPHRMVAVEPPPKRPPRDT